MAECMFTVNIGGFTVSVAFPGGYGDVTLPVSYTHFLSEKTPDVVLRVHCDCFPGDRHREKIFDSGPNWSLYQSGGKYILRTMFQEAIFAPDFRSADIYSLREHDRANPAFFRYPLDEILMINLLCQDQGIVLHACGIVDSDEGILFCGMSGGGKSTLANIWKNHGGANNVLSDDRIIVRMLNGTLTACGTPWHGEAGHCSSQAVQLRKIFFIEHAKKNQAEHISQTKAASSLLVRSFPPLWDKKGMERTLEFVDHLSRHIPCYALGFVPDEGVIDFVRGV